MIDADWSKRATEDLTTGLKLKKLMLDKQLTSARAKCPRCGHDTLQGRLAGRKNHLRCWCDFPGCTFSGMME